jgi:catechol 2,3-dioxygenase-like lactoylglutathione lyase family enzyme
MADDIAFPDASAMRLHRIDHVSLDVSDRQASLAWYEEVLGLRATSRPGPPGEPVFMGPDGSQIALFADRAPGLRHVALATDADGQQQVRQRLERLGLSYTPQRHRSHDSLYFRDPDGITLEVMYPTA